LIALRRPVWLLDEPTSALDAAGQNLFAGLMRDHLARGGLIIAATHTPLGVDARELRIGGGA
jgi:heme exporter protein A